MSHEVMLQIISTAILASSSIGLILIALGKLADQALLYFVPAFMIGLGMFIVLMIDRTKKGKTHGK